MIAWISGSAVRSIAPDDVRIEAHDASAPRNSIVVVSTDSMMSPSSGRPWESKRMSGRSIPSSRMHPVNSSVASSKPIWAAAVVVVESATVVVVSARSPEPGMPVESVDPSSEVQAPTASRTRRGRSRRIRPQATDRVGQPDTVDPRSRTGEVERREGGGLPLATPFVVAPRCAGWATGVEPARRSGVRGGPWSR